MPRLSIIIPALDQFELLEEGLVSVLQNRPLDAEIIVVLRGEYADPYDLADEVRMLSAAPETGLAEAVNAGVAAARAPVVHVLACGGQVEEGWADAPLARFADPRVAAVAPLVLDAAGERIRSAGVAYSAGGSRRELLSGKPLRKAPAVVSETPGAAMSAAFYRRAALAPYATPFDPALGSEFADVDLAIRLRSAGWITLVEPASRVVAPAALSQDASHFQTGRRSERMFWLHRNRSSLALTAHATNVALETCKAVVQPGRLLRLAGRMIGCLEWGFHKRRNAQSAQELTEAIRQFARAQAPKPAPRAKPLRKAA